MEKVKEIIECCICTKRFTNPRILSCIHTFCLGCLEKTALQRDLKSEDVMQCPICSKPFVIPKEGMAALQENLFVERLINCLNSSGESRILCEKCLKFNATKTTKIPNAVQFCIQCRQNICNQCCEDHNRFDELQNHEFIDMKSNPQDQLDLLLNNPSVQFCEQHKTKELEVFCTHCQQVTCTICAAQKHKSHKCLYIAEAAGGFRKQINSDLGQMKDWKAEAAARVKEVAEVQADFQKVIEATEKEIIERGNELKKLVDRHTRSLLDELTAIKQRESKQIACDEEESETRNMVMESFETYCMVLASKGSDAEICYSTKDLRLRTEELHEVHEKRDRQRFSSVAVHFDSSKLEDFLKNDNILGGIRAELIRSSVCVGRSDIPSTSLFYGITKLENRIYIGCTRPDLIHVFDDQSPFALQKQIATDEINQPADIGRCEISKCLYVLESSNNFIWKIAAEDHRVTKWLNISGYIAPWLSVTNEGHLMVFDQTENFSLQPLEIYGSDARLVRRLPLNIRISLMQSIFVKPNGEIIMTHQLGSNGLESWAISRLSSDGQTLLSQFIPRDQSQYLQIPSNFALDEENNRLFLADDLYARVIVFDSNSLKMLQILLTKRRSGIREPHRLFYDGKKKQLFVAQTLGEVDIYQIEGNAASCLSSY